MRTSLNKQIYWWNKIDETESIVRAKIARRLWRIVCSLKGLLDRFQTKENFDPMTCLKVMLKEAETPLSDMPILREYGIKEE